jgi:hypothetical protein
MIKNNGDIEFKKFFKMVVFKFVGEEILFRPANVPFWN